MGEPVKFSGRHGPYTPFKVRIVINKPLRGKIIYPSHDIHSVPINYISVILIQQLRILPAGLD
jgi:hypothetical protein